jgi:hypothetical protein
LPPVETTDTGLDGLLILVLQHYGMRKLKALVAFIVLTIGACLAVEIGLSQTRWAAVISCFAARLDADQLYVAIGILGATVMPHNIRITGRRAILGEFASRPWLKVVVWLFVRSVAKWGGLGRLPAGVSLVNFCCHADLVLRGRAPGGESSWCANRRNPRTSCGRTSGD